MCNRAIQNQGYMYSISPRNYPLSTNPCFCMLISAYCCCGLGTITCFNVERKIVEKMKNSTSLSIYCFVSQCRTSHPLLQSVVENLLSSQIILENQLLHDSTIYADLSTSFQVKIIFSDNRLVIGI